MKCETVTVAMYGGKSVLMGDKSSRRLFFAFRFLLVVYPTTTSVLLAVPSCLRVVLGYLLRAALTFTILNEFSWADDETHFNRDFTP